MNCCNLNNLRDEADLIFDDERTDWDETFENVEKSTELNITKLSLKIVNEESEEEKQKLVKSIIPEGLIMSLEVSEHLYVAKELATHIKYPPGLVYSEYVPIGYKLMIRA